MAPVENFPVKLTSDPEDFEVCALMMSSTDPWITLGMNYENCLKAFEGCCKEIYTIRIQNEIAGFVIIQTGGSFAGYIQTICINEKWRGHGFGRKLLRLCEERIHMFSPNVFICVSSFNEGAKKLYLDYDFKLIGELENFVKQGYNELLLRKTIGPRVGYNEKS